MATTKKAAAPNKVSKKTIARKSVKSAMAKTKKASSKTSSKKRAAPEGRVLICASDGECFWTRDGQVLRDLVELRDALKSMADDVFSHHVTNERNDFAEWVEHVLQDAECAAALRKSKKPNTSRTVVVRHLRYYTL